VPHTLLLADDSVTIQRVIELTFADEDVEVVAVSDGDQAIARLDASPPDIVLADIGMPGRNGYEVARYVKQSPRLSHIPVVLLTGAFEPVDQARAIEVGCDGVLAKPFEPQLVIGRVKELLASESRKPQPVSVPAASLAGAAEHPAAAQPPAIPEPADLDDYFDRLDVAFAKLSAQPLGKSNVELEPEAAAEEGSPKSAFEAPPAAHHAEAPAHTAAPPGRVEPPAAPVPAAPALPAVSAPSFSFAALGASAAAAAAPSIADAFAAILAAEQHEPVADGSPEWPRSFAPPPPPVITDEVIDAVTRRVLDQMSDRIVRETVSGIVADVAERLVREEIAKIKSALK